MCFFQGSKTPNDLLSGVENRNSCCDLFAGVKGGDEVDGARVVGCLGDTEEEAGKQEAFEVF
jgi:hypothetical protein